MKNTGDGRRKVRVEKEVQELISNFIIRQLRNDLPGMVTVTRVQMPADFRTANVYLSYFETTDVDDISPSFDQKAKVDVAEVLQSWASDIQEEIGRTLKMRYCPKLSFYNDETTEKILKIEKILAEIADEPEIADALDEDSD